LEETGKSRIHGVLHGEKMDSSDSPQETLVEFAMINPHGSNENDLIMNQY
jgi:hypothetical protein